LGLKNSFGAKIDSATCLICSIKSVRSSSPKIELEIGQNGFQIKNFSSIFAAKTCAITFHKKLENHPAQILLGGYRRASPGGFATQCTYMYMYFCVYVYIHVYVCIYMYM